jgi:hypothetical protein
MARDTVASDLAHFFYTSHAGATAAGIDLAPDWNIDPASDNRGV